MPNAYAFLFSPFADKYACAAETFFSPPSRSFSSCPAPALVSLEQAFCYYIFLSFGIQCSMTHYKQIPAPSLSLNHNGSLPGFLVLENRSSASYSYILAS